MPTVPAKRIEQTEIALPEVRQTVSRGINSDAFGGTQAKQMQKLGSTLGNAAKAADVIAERNAVEEALAGTVALDEREREVLFTGENAIYSRKGANAKGAAEEYARVHQEKVREIGSTMSERARKKFKALARRKRGQALDSVARHESQQNQIAFINSISASMVSDIEEATLDPEKADEFLADYQDKMELKYKSSGMTGKVAEVEAMRDLTLFHKRMVESMVERDPQAAKDYYEANKENINSKDRVSIEKSISLGLNTVQARAAVEEAINSGLGEEESLANLRQIKNLDVRDEAVRRYKARLSETRAIHARQEKAAEDEARNLISKGSSYDDLPVRLKNSMSGSTRRSLQRLINQRDAEAIAAFKADVKVAVSRGDVTHEDLDKWRDGGRLSAADWASYTISLDKTNAIKMKAAQNKSLVNNAIEIGIPLDPKNKEYQNGVDEHYADQLGEGGMFSDHGINAAVDIASKTGIIPSQARSAIRANVRSTDPKRAAIAADFIARLQEGSPAAYEALPAEEKQFGEMVAASVRAGMEAEDAVSLARKRLWETPKDERQALVSNITSAKVRADTEGRLNDFLDDEFDQSIFTSAPTANLQIKTDYQNLVEQHYVATGDIDLSHKLAQRDLKRVWNVTSLNGHQQMMRTPPESVYGGGKAQPWMKEQLDNIRASIGLEDGERMIFTSDNITARSGKPSYPLWKVDSEGIATPILNMQTGQQLRWTPNYKQTESYLELEKASDAEMKAARTKQDEINAKRSKESFSLFQMSEEEQQRFLEGLK